MSNYELNIYGKLDDEDLKNIDKYLAMVKNNENLIAVVNDPEENQKKDIHKLLQINRITINEEIHKDGLYKVIGIKQKNFNE
ncbi:MAG: hypothetical protein ACM3X7_06475 [Solirubrobacterales bacterium]